MSYHGRNIVISGIIGARKSISQKGCYENTMTDTDQEWYTIQELATMFGVSYAKLRAEINALANIDAIVTRPQPGNNKVQQIHRNSISIVRKATGA